MVEQQKISLDKGFNSNLSPMTWRVVGSSPAIRKIRELKPAGETALCRNKISLDKDFYSN